MKGSRKYDADIRTSEGGFVVRLSIGGYLYFDSPVMSLQQCENTIKNLED